MVHLGRPLHSLQDTRTELARHEVHFHEHAQLCR